MKEVSTPSASNSFNMAKPCESSATLEISFGFKPSRAAQVSALPALPPPSTFNEALRTLSSGFGNPSTVARKSTAVIPNPTCTTCQNQNNNKHIYRERGGGEKRTTVRLSGREGSAASEEDILILALKRRWKRRRELRWRLKTLPLVTANNFSTHAITTERNGLRFRSSSVSSREWVTKTFFV